MKRSSDDLYSLLMRQGLAGDGMERRRLRKQIRAKARAEAASKKGADAAREEGQQRPLTEAAEGGPRVRSGMGKNAEAEAPASDGSKRQRSLGGEAKPRVSFEVHTNPDMTKMAMRQTTHTQRAVAPRGVVSLMVIEGGKP